MLRRELYTNERVRQMRVDNRIREYADKEKLQMVARDTLIAAKMAAEERVENKRYVLVDQFCLKLPPHPLTLLGSS